MILKLVDNKIIVETMFVPELKKHTYIEYVFEHNTKHLHPVLYINGADFKGYKTFIDFNKYDLNNTLILKVELLDDQEKVVRSYQSELEYNEYQILGIKPIRPDIEQYLYNLEGEIKHLKNEIVLLDLKHKKETASLIEKFELLIEKLKSEIKTLEEKGEIV
jgi:hypothetical protein